MTRIVAKYEYGENTSEAFNILIEPDVLGLFIEPNVNNIQSNRAVRVQMSVNADAGRSRAGVNARGVKIRWVGEPPDGYARDGVLFVPVLRESRWKVMHVGTQGTYKSATILLVGKIPETVR